MFSKIGLQFRYYRVLSKALLGFSVPDNQPSMTAHYNKLNHTPTPPVPGVSNEVRSIPKSAIGSAGHRSNDDTSADIRKESHCYN